MEITGSTEQIAALTDDDEYLRIQAEARIIVLNLRAAVGYTGNGIARMMEIYAGAVAKAPQMA